MDNRIIVREYLESLKEDQELDAIFPLLLIAKGFRLLATPIQAKGQSQYGKDVVAIGKEGDTIYRYYFELKGGGDRHVTPHTFSKNDGIRMSLLEAKYTAFNSAGTPSFSKLPIKFVLVHNGEIKENFRPTFSGFIDDTFPDENFERWDINRLAEEFDTSLFNEYLIPNPEDSRLFRRVLLLIDTPDYDLVDFKELVLNQLNRMPTPDSKRRYESAWATLILLGQIVWHKCRQNNNLYPAIQALNFLLLTTWAWVLRNMLEGRREVIKAFRRLNRLHFELIREYFQKTSGVAILPDGLFAEGSGMFETIGYPLRSFDYLGLLIYYFEASHYYPDFDGKVNEYRKLRLESWHKNYLIKLVEANSACQRPVLDAHSVPILATFMYFARSEILGEADEQFLESFLTNILHSIFVIKKLGGRFPSLSLRLESLVEYTASGNRPSNYSDDSSLLLPILFEVTAYFDIEKLWDFILQTYCKEDVNMQTAYPVKEIDVEQNLFVHHLHDEFYVEHSLRFPETARKHFEVLKAMDSEQIPYRTDKAGFPYLRTLAHIYHQTEFFPADWRDTLLRFRQEKLSAN